MSNPPYGYQPNQQPYPAQGGQYGQPNPYGSPDPSAMPGVPQGYGQPQQYAQPQGYGQPQGYQPYGQPETFPQAGASQVQPGEPLPGPQAVGLYQPGDEQRFPYGLPPDVVAERLRAAAPDSQPSAPVSQPSAPVSQPSAPVSQPSAPVSQPGAPLTDPYAPAPDGPYVPQSQASAPAAYAPQSQSSAPAAEGYPAVAPQQPYDSYAPADPNPYAPQSQESVPTPEANPYAPQEPTPYPPAGAPQPYPTYSAQQPSVPQPTVAGETNLQPRDDERPADQGWMIELDDGREVEIHGVALLGRNPQPRPGENAQLVTIGDETRKISKTHFAVGVDERGIYLCDRGSTNGTAIENAPDDFRPCPEGEMVRLAEGQKISFGDHSLLIRRR